MIITPNNEELLTTDTAKRKGVILLLSTRGNEVINCISQFVLHFVHLYVCIYVFISLPNIFDSHTYSHTPMQQVDKSAIQAKTSVYIFVCMNERKRDCHIFPPKLITELITAWKHT